VVYQLNYWLLISINFILFNKLRFLDMIPFTWYILYIISYSLLVLSLGIIWKFLIARSIYLDTSYCLWIQLIVEYLLYHIDTLIKETWLVYLKYFHSNKYWNELFELFSLFEDDRNRLFILCNLFRDDFIFSIYWVSIRCLYDLVDLW
jgi:hypothetical protein